TRACYFSSFSFSKPSTPKISTLSLHDALPILHGLSSWGNWSKIVFGRRRCQLETHPVRLSFRVAVLRLRPPHVPLARSSRPMMRSMRAIYKPVFFIVSVTFIGWLAYGQVTDILGGGRDVVLKVNGQVVRAPQFQAALQAAIEESRRQTGARLTREDEQQLQDQVTDQFIQKILLEREYRRLGIQVSDVEVRQ